MKSPFIAAGFAYSYDPLSHLTSCIVIVPIRKEEGGVMMMGAGTAGWSGLGGARGPPAVADDSADSPAGDGEGGAFHTSPE